MKVPEVKVTRKYQITIPEEIRKQLKINIGEKLPIKRVRSNIIIATRKTIRNPVEYMWSIRKKPANIDAVRLIKELRKKMK